MLQTPPYADTQRTRLRMQQQDRTLRHVSLSRTVPMRFHDTESLLMELKRELRAMQGGSLIMSGLRCFVNDEGTRSFISVPLCTGKAQVLQAIHHVDKAFSSHGLPKFHKDAEPHMSFAWVLGDQRERSVPAPYLPPKSSCKGVSALMLRSAAVIDKVKTQLPIPNTQLSVLAGINQDLYEAHGRVTLEQCAHRNFPSQHTQLLRSFAALVQALVAQLRTLDIAASAGVEFSSECTCASDIHLSTGNHLWTLLSSACNSHKQWPAWPARGTSAEYAAVRDALHHMMSLLLRMTRASGSFLGELWECMDPFNRQRQVSAMLSVGHRYIVSISGWPVPSIVNELASLPSEFIPMLCCLLLEQLGEVAPAPATETAAGEEGGAAEAEGAAAAAAGPAAAAAAAPTTDPYNLISTLVPALTAILTAAVHNNSPELAVAFATPAVIELYKRAVVLRKVCREPHKPRGSTPGCCADEVITVSILMSHLSTAWSLQLQAAAHPSLAAFCAAEGIAGGHLSPLYQPLSPPCDLALMSAIYRQRCLSAPDSGLVALRWELLRGVMRSWGCDDASQLPHLPFPPPPAHDQARGVYTAAYQCSDDIALWMEQQRWQLGGGGQGRGEGRPVLAKAVQPVLTAVFTNHAVCSGIAGLEAATFGGWAGGFGVQGQPVDPGMPVDPGTP
ncbi:MAG: hypothetical protein WDW36_005462 [Sanguina aurantia]